MEKIKYGSGIGNLCTYLEFFLGFISKKAYYPIVVGYVLMQTSESSRPFDPRNKKSWRGLKTFAREAGRLGKYHPDHVRELVKSPLAILLPLLSQSFPYDVVFAGKFVKRVWYHSWYWNKRRGVYVKECGLGPIRPSIEAKTLSPVGEFQVWVDYLHPCKRGKHKWGRWYSVEDQNGQYTAPRHYVKECSGCEDREFAEDLEPK
jgi:hypothetical protein